MKQKTTDIIDAIDEEVHRVKEFANTHGNNGSALTYIVRQYRQALKDYRKVVADDRADDITSY